MEGLISEVINVVNVTLVGSTLQLLDLCFERFLLLLMLLVFLRCVNLDLVNLCLKVLQPFSFLVLIFDIAFEFLKAFDVVFEFLFLFLDFVL